MNGLDLVEREQQNREQPQSHQEATEEVSTHETKVIAGQHQRPRFDTQNLKHWNGTGRSPTEQVAQPKQQRSRCR